MDFELTFTARNVLLGASLLGALGGMLGCFALLRRQSLLGDALAHAALPGVCLAFLLTGSKEPLPLFTGALLAGVAGALLILAVVRGSRVKEDAAIGIVLSVFFGFGIVLLTHIQRLPGGNQSGLDKFLFGQAATLVEADLKLMAILGTAVLAALALFYKELKLLTFDREFGATVGLPMRRLEILLTLLLVVVVVVGLQTVGVVLMVATILTPAAAARQWTDRLGVMLFLAGGLGAASGAAGAMASATLERLPTGPVIVLTASVALVVSLLVAPGRGILWALRRERQAGARIRRENVLKDLWLAGERGGSFERAVTLAHLMGVRGERAGALAASLRPLRRRGLVEDDGEALRLTPEGRREAARVVRKHRIWELYLTRRLELPPDHVHRDAEAMEHVLSDTAVDELEERLGFPGTDPHGRRIPGREATA